ncbi:heterogeneous nuclear ribonucleoprotein 27C isoform X3 [Hetaerina americana]|uniref:heterogeneous nuclear ribonucleoprotein 27C isoform X3 n=1 Tax=Hetaerina americana TaxID=62018 RepID=UPI003A7F2F3B
MRVKNENDGEEKGMVGSDDNSSGRQSSSNSNEKLFVGGLSWETNQDTLQRYFSRYGEVIDCVVMKNSETGRSRGFGFVTFSDPANVAIVLQNGPHQLDGRTIDPKPCNPRSMQRPKRNVNWPKVFLGGLPSNVTETDLRSFFQRYGKVMEVVIMYDQEKKKSRGFGFLSFETDESVERCVAEHFIQLNGKQVEIKKAEPRDLKLLDGSQNQWGPPPGGPPLGMGGGMGPMGAPNGQMGGPMGGPMGPMGPPGGMMQGYQGWGTPPQQQGYGGYGNPPGPGGYQGWGAPPGPQGQQMPPPQWGPNYGGPPQQQGYGTYGPPQGGPQPGYGGNWNWNMPQNGPPPPGGPPGPPQGPPGPPGDMYARPTGPGGVNPPGPPAPGPGPTQPGGGGPTPKPPGDFPGYPNQYGSMGNYPQQDSSSYGPARSYVPDSSGGGYSHPPPPGGQGEAAGGSGGGSSGGGYTGGPGPQRGGNYSQPSQAQSFHPYRRM